MVGAGTFEIGIGLSFTALNLYFVFRDRVSRLVLVLLVVALAPILGVTRSRHRGYPGPCPGCTFGFLRVTLGL